MTLERVYPLAYGMAGQDLEALILATLAQDYGLDISGMSCVFLPGGL
jgi:hypothetical protein